MRVCFAVGDGGVLKRRFHLWKLLDFLEACVRLCLEALWERTHSPNTRNSEHLREMLRWLILVGTVCIGFSDMVPPVGDRADKCAVAQRDPGAEGSEQARGVDGQCGPMGVMVRGGVPRAQRAVFFGSH